MATTVAHSNGSAAVCTTGSFSKVGLSQLGKVELISDGRRRRRIGERGNASRSFRAGQSGGSGYRPMRRYILSDSQIARREPSLIAALSTS